MFHYYYWLSLSYHHSFLNINSSCGFTETETSAPPPLHVTQFGEPVSQSGVFQHVLLVSLLRCHRGAAGGRMRPGFTAQGGPGESCRVWPWGGQKHVVWTCTAESPRKFIPIKLCSLNMKLIFLWFCRSSSGAVRLHLCSIFSLCSLPAEPARALTPDSVQIIWI